MLDLIVEKSDMVFKDESQILRSDPALEPVDFRLAGGVQVFQQAHQGLQLSQFLSGRVPGRRGLSAAEISNDGGIKAIGLVTGQQAPGIGADPGRVDQADKVLGSMQDFCYREGILPGGFQADMHLLLAAAFLQPADQALVAFGRVVKSSM